MHQQLAAIRTIRNLLQISPHISWGGFITFDHLRDLIFRKTANPDKMLLYLPSMMTHHWYCQLRPGCISICSRIEVRE
jgi:hypothetical protein